MNHSNWQSRFDRLDRGGDAGEGWDKLLDDLADDLVEPYDFDEALRRPFLHRTRARLRAVHVTERTRLLDAIEPDAEKQQDCPPMKRRQKGLMNMIARKSFLIPAAAATLAILASTVWFETRFDSHAAFAQMIENVRQVNSVSFTEVEQATSKLRATFKHAYIDSPRRTRDDILPDGVEMTSTSIFDGTKLLVYFFVPQFKTACVTQMSVEEGAGPSANRLLQGLRDLTSSSSSEYLGQRETDGVLCHVYRCPLSTELAATAWYNTFILEVYISVESLYPVRVVEFSYLVDVPQADQKELMARRISSDFHWNVELGPEIFQVQIPEGWELVELPKDIKPHELRIWAEERFKDQEVRPSP